MPETQNISKHRHMPALTLVLVIAFLSALLTINTRSGSEAQAQQAENPLIFTLSGGGWGHGVGMSQYGAWGRSSAGHSAAEILGHYYPGTTIEPITSFDNVRVHLATTPSTTVTASQPITLVNDTGDEIVTNDPSGTFTWIITRAAGTFTVTDGEGTNLCLIPDTSEPPVDILGTPSERLPSDAAAVVAQAEDDDEEPEPEPVDTCIGSRIALQYADGQPVTLGATGIRYARGQLGFVATGSSMYVVAENLDMDTYLYGLAEVPASWPTAALETQAIAGRSYAMETIQRRRNDTGWTNPWDMYSTVRDQAYLGYNHETSAQAGRWVQAVNSTSLQVMTWNGNPIPAFYSSSNGGHSEDSGYVFFFSFPYFVAEPDAFDHFNNPFSTWERDYTSTELSRWIAQSSIGSVGTIRSIDVSGRLGASGRTDKATVTIYGSERTATTNGWQLMAIINGGVGRDGGGVARMALSTKYTITVTGQQPSGSLDRVSRSGTQLTVAGWFYDLDDSGSSPVEIHVDGQFVATVDATQPRFDTATALQQGTNRGFVATVTVTDEPHQVCVYGTNTAGDPKMLLECVTTD